MTLLRDRQAVRAFERQDPSFRDIVFYSEGAADWPHIGPIVEDLIGRHGRTVSYVTSDEADPGLRIEHELLRSFAVGSGTMRTVLFARLACRVLVTSLPDLDALWLKRSLNPVHYAYLFHSTNSTHTSYREDAFDAYDTIFCVGPHHVSELRRAETVRNLREKALFEHGSVKLDSVMARLADTPPNLGEVPGVVVAPTWGESSLIERPVGESVIMSLVNAGIGATMRLHPMTVRRMPQLVAELQRRFGHEPLFRLESDMNADQSWLSADVMVTDWSGAAVEYAFSLERPVIFIDTPPKIRNPEWTRIGLPAFEASIRDQVGEVLDESDVDHLPGLVRQAGGRETDVRASVRDARNRSIFNVGRSAVVASDHLAAL